jgi:hypothetical protein
MTPRRPDSKKRTRRADLTALASRVRSQSIAANVAPSGRQPRASYLLFAKHPAWIKRQHDSALEQEYVDSLAGAMRWAFNDAAPGLEPTCAGMADVNATE